MDERIEIGLALVSQEGLIFNGKLYSNSMMIKEKWFIKARKQGEWKVPILFDFNTLDEVVVLHLEVASSIERPIEIQLEVRQVYYEALENLKNQLYQLTKKRRASRKKKK
jgi:hypothetical protein